MIKKALPGLSPSCTKERPDKITSAKRKTQQNRTNTGMSITNKLISPANTNENTGSKQLPENIFT
jgi:hypothetical protein